VAISGEVIMGVSFEYFGNDEVYGGGIKTTSATTKIFYIGLDQLLGLSGMFLPGMTSIGAILTRKFNLFPSIAEEQSSSLPLC